MPIQTLKISSYKYGLVNSIESRSIPRGAASSSLNWLTKGDKIELRRGSKFLGDSSVNSGTGKTTGLRVARDANGNDQLFGTYGKKLKYFNRTTEEWVENGSDLLGDDVVDANGFGKEPISMSPYTSLAGNQLFVNSPFCAGLFKVMVSNPGDNSNVYASATNFKGHIKIDTNRMLLWGRKEDPSGLYGSYIDTQNYTTVSAEALGGSGKTRTGTLAFKAGNPRNTCFGVTISDVGGISEIFTDNYDGTLSSPEGGTGTINYTTGAYSITFFGTPTGTVKADYQHEDSNSAGITDFTKSPTRTPGQGFIFRQDEGGGDLKKVNQYDQIYYCMHVKKTWVLNITSDDTNATNLPYREKVGIPNERASVETGDGIYYIDDQDPNDKKCRLLTYDVAGSAKVIPVAISNNIDLSDYRFDQAATAEFGDFILFACATNDSIRTVDGKTEAINNRVLVYNKLWKSWDILDYAVSVFEVYNGALVSGDSYTNNFIELFSDFVDIGDADIANHWEGNLDNFDIEGLKKTKQLVLQGAIAPTQKLKVSLSFDNGPFVEVKHPDDADTKYAIEGDGTYIDQTQRVSIGPATLGRTEIGGGGDGLQAYNYQRIIPLRFDKFEMVKIRYEAVGVGYLSVSTQTYWDIRYKGTKVPSKYRG